MCFKVRRAYFIISCIIRSEIFFTSSSLIFFNDAADSNLAWFLFSPEDYQRHTDLFNFFLYFKQYPLIWAKLELIV